MLTRVLFYYVAHYILASSPMLMSFTLGDVAQPSHKVSFEDVHHGRPRVSKLELGGVPFIIAGSKLMECHQGPLRRRPVQTSSV